MPETEKQYVVWSSEHSAWWGPDEAGYFTRLGHAGRYTRDEALEICRGARGGRQYNETPSEVPLLLKDAEIFWPDEPDEWRREKDRRRHERWMIENAAEEGDF